MKTLVMLRDIFILFILFAVCGWIYEVLLTLWAYGFFENRGVLFGPWLPVYGFGGLVLYFVLRGAVKKPAKAWQTVIQIIITFISICLITTVIELAASYILELFGTDFRTLWNYSSEPLNFEGRVGIISSLRFGVLGIFALYAAIPLWSKLIVIKHQKPLTAVTVITAALFITDVLARIPLGSNL